MEDRAMNAPHAETGRGPRWTLAVGVLIGAIVLGQARQARRSSKESVW